MIAKHSLGAPAASAALLWLLAAPALAAGPPSTTSAPDFTQGDVIPDGATHDWNLGPTGARGWMHSNKMETSEARQVLITEVDEGSPADGVLQPGDVILGVAGRPFAYDPRTELGKAIGAAEAAGPGGERLEQPNAQTGLSYLGRYADRSLQSLAGRLARRGRHRDTSPGHAGPDRGERARPVQSL
jgi:hypothetical protein